MDERIHIDGWDYPPLQRVLQGIITEQGANDLYFSSI